MTIDVALHQAGFDRIAERLEALKLPVRLLLLQRDGRYLLNGRQVALAENPPEAAWLSLDVGVAGQFGSMIDDLLAAGGTRWLQTFNAGLDDPRYVDIARAGIRVSASSAQAVAISEYTFAHVLNVYQPIEAQRRLQATKEWKRLPFRELSRATWVIVGFGNIGREVAKRAKAFGSRVLAVRRRPEPSPLADEVAGIEALPRMLSEADVVVLSAPHTRETERMADAGFFGALKKGAILVNVARGGLVDDAALLRALDDGTVSTAVLDVFEPEPLPTDDPYWSHPKVRLTAHSSFAGEGTIHRGDDLFLTNLPRYLAGEPLVNEVDVSYLLEG